MNLRSASIILFFLWVPVAAYGLAPRLKSHQVTMAKQQHAFYHNYNSPEDHHQPLMKAATIDVEIPLGSFVDYGVWILPNDSNVNYHTAIQESKILARPSLQEVLRKFLDWYMISLKRNPLLTRAISGAVVSMVGDVISQSITLATSRYIPHVLWDLRRTFSFGLIGMLFTSPFLSAWYGAVAKFGARLQQRRHLTDNQRVMAELALDQTVGVVIYYPAFFFVFELVAAFVQNRGDANKDPPRLLAKRMLGPHPLSSSSFDLSAFAFPAFTSAGFAPIFSAMCANYAFWPWSQWFSFTFVPQQLRVLYSSLAAIIWNIFFCAIVAGAS